MAQFFRISLKTAPAILGIGSYSTADPLLQWHQPADKWQIVATTFGGVVTCNGFEVPFRPSTVLVFPPRARCQIVRAGPEPYQQLYCWFQPDDSKEEEVAVPQCKEIGDRMTWLIQDWLRVIDRLPFSRVSQVSLVWQVLWSIAEGPQNVRRSVYVERVEELIHDRISRSIRVADLAREVQLSQSQLNRLFRQEHGTTVQEYIRLERVNLACRLLTSTTEPIKSIAVRCGVPELSNFGKLVRDTLGASPRQIRAERKLPSLFVDLQHSEEKAQTRAGRV